MDKRRQGFRRHRRKVFRGMNGAVQECGMHGREGNVSSKAGWMDGWR